MKKLLSRTIWTMVIIYASLMIMLHIPAIQTGIAGIVGSELEKTIGSKVEVKRVDLGFLNRIVVDELVVFDQNRERMLRVPRLSVKIDLLEAIQGKINLSSAQLFGLDANIYKNKENEDYNFQFIVDSLSSDDNSEKTPLDLHISSLVILNGKIKHNLRYLPKKQGSFDANHLDISKLSSHIILYKITDDSLDVNIKRLSMKESCGLDVNNLALRLKKAHDNITLSDFNLETGKSSISIPSFTATYTLKDGKLQERGLRADLKATIKALSLDEIALFAPFNPAGLPSLKGTISASCNDGDVDSDVNLKANDKSFDLQLNGRGQHILSDLHWMADRLHLNVDGGLIQKVNNMTALPAQVLALGSITIDGRSAGTDKSVKFDGQIITSECGDITLDGSYDQGDIEAKVKTSAFELGKILGNNDLGTISTDLNGKVKIAEKKLTSASVNGEIANVSFRGYTYNDIKLEGEYHDGALNGVLDIRDQNANFSISADASLDNAVKKLTADIDVDRLNLVPLNLLADHKSMAFSLKSKISLEGSNIDDVRGSVSLSDIHISGEQNNSIEALENGTGDIYINDITLRSIIEKASRELSLKSDFADVSLKGDFKLAELQNSFLGLLKSHLPSLPLGKNLNARRNNITLNAEIRSADLLKRFLGVKFDIEKPITLQGYLNDFSSQSNIYCHAPAFSFDGKKIENLKLLLWTPEQSLRSNLTFSLANMAKDPLGIVIESNAERDILSTSISWDNHQKDEFSGQLNTKATFQPSHDGKTLTKVSITPSNIHIGDSIWRLHSRDIIYSGEKLSVDHFAIENANQHIYINGAASKYASDQLAIDLKKVDVAYILNLVNFHSVEFGGYASGHFVGHSLFSSPEAEGHIDVDDFKFQYGGMGDFHADVKLNNETKQIDIKAFTENNDDKYMDIVGFVSPQRNELDLDIKAEKVPLEFMHSFCSSFMQDIDAWGHGNVRLAGPLSALNLTGKIVANGAVTVSSLNCRYTLRNDTVIFVPNDMRLENQPIYDKHGNIAYFTGGLHHQNLSRMTYDFDIKAKKFLCYDFDDFGENPFYGRAIMTGDCKITGRSSELTFDVKGDVEADSYVVYNASGPDAISNQEFITWNSAAKSKLNGDKTGIKATENEEDEDDVKTNMHMNFLLNVTPSATLKVLMDSRTGDMIDLHGSGVLRANYYNKGKFDLFGNYLINDGTYKMTIQNVVRRDFDFLSGGSINFGGDPFDAILNLQARYTLNSVSLSDLRIGNSFSSNNIRVDCLMDITGTCGSPMVTFNLEPHTNNTDVKQMIYSLINSEEEINQQVLYLLSVGRFYAQTGNNAGALDAAGNSQTSLAMQSVLSGALSKQMSNILGKYINSSNWNFGANISPGDEGFNNAEYEGLLNGSLLNNRLLINGQFGYRDNAATATQGFIGDFDVRYLLLPSGNLAIRVYNQTNDRYFTKNSLNTQGLGLILKRDFSSWRDLLKKKK